MIVLDLFWILMLWVVIGLLAAMVIGRASDLGKGSDNENAISAQPRKDAALEAPRRRYSNRKRLAGSTNENLADTNEDRGGVKEKQAKRAA